MKKTVLKGPLYNYLGHFRQPKYLNEGHNTSVYIPEAGGPVGGKPQPGAVNSVERESAYRSNVWSKQVGGGGTRTRIYGDGLSATGRGNGSVTPTRGVGSLREADPTQVDYGSRAAEQVDRAGKDAMLADGWKNERFKPALFNERPKIGPK